MKNKSPENDRNNVAFYKKRIEERYAQTDDSNMSKVETEKDET